MLDDSEVAKRSKDTAQRPDAGPRAADRATNNYISNVAPRVAYTRQRAGRRREKFGPWMEIGRGRVDADGTARVFLDRLPIGGFSGLVVLPLVGEMPPEPPM